MIRTVYVDPVEKEFIESHRIDGIKFDISVYIENASLRTYLGIAERVKSLIYQISWFRDEIHLPDIIFEDIILKEIGHKFVYESDTVTYQITDLQLDGIDAHTGKYRIIANVEMRGEKKVKNSQIELAYSYGLN